MPWLDGEHTATCIEPDGYPFGWDSTPHEAPGVSCERGIRGGPLLDDTPTTLRAQCARVGRRVFFARPLWSLADDFERRHPWSQAVRIGTLGDLLREGLVVDVLAQLEQPTPDAPDLLRSVAG